MSGLLPTETFIMVKVTEHCFKADDGTHTQNFESLWGVIEALFKAGRGTRKGLLPSLINEVCVLEKN